MKLHTWRGSKLRCFFPFGITQSSLVIPEADLDAGMPHCLLPGLPCHEILPNLDFYSSMSSMQFYLHCFLLQLLQPGLELQL